MSAVPSRLRSLTRFLGFKLVVASLVIEVVMLSLLLATSSRITAGYLEEQFDRRLADEGKLLNAALVAPVFQRDFGALADLLSLLCSKESIEYLVVLDRKGTVMAASGWPAEIPLPPPSGGRPAALSGRFDTVVPIAALGQSLGTLHFGVSTTFFAQARNSLLGIGIAIAAAEILLSAALLATIGYWLTRRLRAVTTAAEAIAAGALDARVDTGSGTDEVDRLGASFNIMADALAARVRELAILSRAVEHSPVSIIITGIDGTIEYVNPQFTAATGYSAAEAIGATPRILKSGDTPAKDYAALWATITAGDIWRGAFRNRHKDGKLFWEEAAIAPVKDGSGRITHFVGIKLDVTASRQREQALRQAVDSLTAVNSELQRFAYVASHDLQEPLRTVVSFTQLLERKFAGRLDADGEEYIRLVVGAGKRMHELINDLLAYSRIGGSDRPFVPTSAKAACQAAIDNLRDSIAASGAEIAVGDLPEVMAEEIQLVQLFQNLLGNAVKFHRPGAQPRVSVSASRDGNAFTFTVSDNGIGFDPGEQDVFEIFRRLHPVQSYPGTGVGLAICRRIVQRHGGHIWVSSRPGQGSTFSFTLPAP